MGSFGGLEWIVIGLAVLLLFGAKRIPELARGLGQGIKEFRKASDDIKKEIEEGQHAEPSSSVKKENASTSSPETASTSSPETAPTDVNEKVENQ